MQFKKIDKTCNKKFFKKKQYYFQQAQNSETPMINISVACNSKTYKSIYSDGIRKNLSYITYFKYGKKSYYMDKCFKSSKDLNIAKK